MSVQGGEIDFRLSELSNALIHFQKQDCPFVSAVEDMNDVKKRMDKIEGKVESVDNLEKRLKERDKAPKPKPVMPGLPGRARGW